MPLGKQIVPKPRSVDLMQPPATGAPSQML
jgi:hypothetical protein